MVNEHISVAVDELKQAKSKCDGLGTSMMLDEAIDTLERIQRGYDNDN